ncbi:hypothetical protein EYF80_014685 [Liparis tanakae]|uniref:Uncharacterized protein n=1 Tax=Liparis tanakae TaxID=230148 RepID=A0A4Z2ICF8_9TELE|nr:hypothetical protein EYF80_014685 [Liparis tanakae]
MAHMSRIANLHRDLFLETNTAPCAEGELAQTGAEIKSHQLGSSECQCRMSAAQRRELVLWPGIANSIGDRNVAEENAFKLDRVDIHKREETSNESQSRAETWTTKRLKAGLVEKSWAQQAQEKANLACGRQRLLWCWTTAMLRVELQHHNRRGAHRFSPKRQLTTQRGRQLTEKHTLLPSNCQT